ncbi:MAG TPA: prolipoprotein diacylglyceryl transferase [Verrucomicrobiales bacterium]|nr:prolipoprotein diacylglyceryl transferase [Verrucomicrobiales bacterium]
MESLLAYYLHDLDPYIFRIGERFGPRWYGLSYVAAFMAGYGILLRLARKGYTRLSPAQVGDFIVLAAIFGVLLGGRMGSMLLYQFDEFRARPWIFFTEFGQGGMASHGGIVGLALFTLWYAWRHRLSWPGLGDDLVCVAPLGIFFVRLANFINGELYGRATRVAWAVLFPDELTRLPLERRIAFERAALLADPEAPDLRAGAPAVLETVRRAGENPKLEEVLRETLTPRHPSQIYQALMEGLLLFLLLMAVRLRWKQLPAGLLTGLFFLGYAVLRIAGERFREPDALPIYGLTRGEFYSALMIPVGLAFLLYAWLGRGLKSAAGPGGGSGAGGAGPRRN